MESVQLEARVHVKFLVKLGWKPPAILDILKTVYGDDAPDLTAYRWILEFKVGRESAEGSAKKWQTTDIDH